MKVAIASDHAGFTLKESLKSFLKSQKIDVRDYGTHSADSVDYPDFAKLVASDVSLGKADAGVLVCGSGIGMAMTANKYTGVRAVVISDEFDAEMSRKHNNANVACFGERKTPEETAVKLLKLWLDTKFEGGRHQKRVDKIKL